LRRGHDQLSLLKLPFRPCRAMCAKELLFFLFLELFLGLFSETDFAKSISKLILENRGNL
jgi:hypothetical protein